MSEFYLTDLVLCRRCEKIMEPVWWREQRKYVCTRCSRRLDAVDLETRVWESARRVRPQLGHALTPYPYRGVRLAAELVAVVLDNDDGFTLTWKQNRPNESHPRNYKSEPLHTNGHAHNSLFGRSI